MKVRVVVGALLGTVLVGGVAYAGIPDTAGVVHSCYSKAKGTWRPIDPATQRCKKGEVALSWNQKGPKGDIGLAGPQGVQGPTGSGASTVYIRPMGGITTVYPNAGAKTVAKLVLPPGPYRFDIKAMAFADSTVNHNLSCGLWVGNTWVDGVYNYGDTVEPGTYANATSYIDMLLVRDIGFAFGPTMHPVGTPLELRCETSGANGYVALSRVTMAATPVASIVVSE